MGIHNVSNVLINQQTLTTHLLTPQLDLVQTVIIHAVLIVLKIDETFVEVNGQCLSGFINIINTVGGINMLISVGIIVCAIIGYLIIVLF